MKNSKALLQLNIGLIFLSTSGVLGRYITVDSILTTLMRAGIASLILIGFCIWIKTSFQIKEQRDRILIFISGVLLGAHWVTYFFALDYSNVAIALLSLYTYAGLTAIIEPLFLRTPFSKVDIFLSMIVFVGVLIMAPSFDINNSYTQAIIFGLLSSLFYALRNIAISIPAKKYDGSLLMVYQLIAMCVIMIPFLGFYDFTGAYTQLPWIILLALLTTAIGHTMFVKSLNQLNATTASLLSCIVPVYGILWAYLILGEVPSGRTLLGGTIIMSSVVFKTLQTSKSK